MLPQIRKILYATDLTENSAYAFYFAIDFAQDTVQRLSFYMWLNLYFWM